MIEITISEILSSEKTLGSLSTQKLPASAAFKVARLIKALRAEMPAIDESRGAIADKYGERDEKDTLKVGEGGSVPIKKEAMADFVKEMEQLLLSKITINAEPIPMTILDKLDLTPQEAEYLYPFIENE